MNKLADSQRRAGRLAATRAATHAATRVATLTRADWLLPLLIATPLLIALQGFDGDQAIMARIYDANAQRFPLNRDWWLSVVLHDWARWPVIALWLAVGGALVAAWWRARHSQREGQWEVNRDGQHHLSARMTQQDFMTLLFAFVAMLACTALIATIKHFSVPACPYRLTMYGGAAPRLSVFDLLPDGVRAGRCWPGGHASTAFALFCWYFIARARFSSGSARAVLFGILVFGAVLTTAQVLRGTHWPSDQLWTALFCWYITLCVLGASNAYLRRGR